MSRRYLTRSEARGAITRGKQIDAFLGGGVSDDVPTIKYLTVRPNAGRIVAELWEVEDPQDPQYHDVYSLYPPHGDDAPEVIFTFDSIDEALSELEHQFPGSSSRYMNQGVIDAEYADYKANGSQ